MATLGASARRGWPGGLRLQLLLTLVLGCGLVLALMILATLQVAKTHMSEQSVQHARVLAELLDAEMMALPASQDGEARQQALAQFRQRSALTLTAWHHDQRHLMDAASEEAAARYAAALASWQASPRDEVRMITLHDAPHLWVTRRHSGDDSVTLIAMPLTLTQARLDRARATLLSYALINAVFIIILGYAAMTRLVLRPVRAIGVAADRAASGDLASPITQHPNNELGQVGRSFNTMLARLNQQRLALEQQVEQLARANHTLQLTQDSLLRSEKLASVGQLAAGVAHEIGNPLAALSGYTELMQGGDLEADEQADVLHRMRQQLDRIQTIIRQMLDFSRDDGDLPLEPVQLATIVEEACALARATPRGKHARLDIALPDDGLPEVWATASQVMQILLNLLINALDAMHAAHITSAHLIISARVDEQAVRLDVRDHGPGVAPAIAARIFDPFFTTKPPGQGTGLGLAVSARLMARFGGELSVASAEGGGACFTLCFPRRAGAPARPEA